MVEKPDQTLGRVLEAEKAVLGALLIAPERWDEVIEHVTALDFQREAHKLIFGAMATVQANRAPLEFATVLAELARIGKLDDAGGPIYLTGLVDGIPRATNVGHYAASVREFAVMRGLREAGTAIQDAALKGERTAAEQLDAAERSLFNLRSRQQLMAVLDAETRTRGAYDLLERLQGGGGDGVPTGLRDLDKMTRGLHGGHLVTVAARPGMGKTAWLLGTAIKASDATKRPALLFSVEMGADELALREVAYRAGVDSWLLQGGKLPEHEYQRKVSPALDAMAAGGVWVVDAPVLSVGQIRAISRRVQTQHGISFVGIDYLQLLTPERSESRSEQNRTLELSAMTRALKGLARDLNTPVVMLSQLSRAVEQRADKRPMLSDLRESGSIEQDSDVVLFLFRPVVYDPTAEAAYAELIVAKQRSGPIGIVKAAYLSEQTKFADWSGRS
jgi:replicative DNA helicase